MGTPILDEQVTQGLRLLSRDNFTAPQLKQLALLALKKQDYFSAVAAARKHMVGQSDLTSGEILQVAHLERLVAELNAMLMIGFSPIERLLAQSYEHLHAGHFSDSYVPWRLKRIYKIMEVFGTDVKGKRILDLGAGLGDIGSIFAEMGAEVVGLEGRAINCNLARMRFRNLPNYQIEQCDLEEDFTAFGRFDLIINFGLVEVIKDFENLLERCMYMSDFIILETMVCDSTDPNKVIFVTMPPETCNDWPLSGLSPRPSPTYIERLFEERGFAVNRHFDADLNSHPHYYNWKHYNDNSTIEGLRRFWSFVKPSSNVE